MKALVNDEGYEIHRPPVSLPLSDEEIQFLEGLWNRATPNAWGIDRENLHVFQYDENRCPAGGGIADAHDEYPRGDNNPLENMMLIVAMRNALPRLLHEIQARREGKVLARLAVQAELPFACGADPCSLYSPDTQEYLDFAVLRDEGKTFTCLLDEGHEGDHVWTCDQDEEQEAA
jgi:hypothetical protein